MPLHDHFRPPLSLHTQWESFHAGWPMVMVTQMQSILPARYRAAPRARLGQSFEVDVGTFDNLGPNLFDANHSASGGTSTQTSTAVDTVPTYSSSAELLDEDQFEVLIYDEERSGELVAAIEFVSPGNKDRDENRIALVNKCRDLLQAEVCVSIIDIVTHRSYNFYNHVIGKFQCVDPAFTKKPVLIYATTSRLRDDGQKLYLDNWATPLVLGQPLPTLPIWLNQHLSIPLPLETSYEETYRILRFPTE